MLERDAAVEGRKELVKRVTTGHRCIGLGRDERDHNVVGLSRRPPIPGIGLISTIASKECEPHHSLGMAGRLVASRSINALPKEIRMPVVSGVLLNHVDQDPAQ